MLPNSTRCEVIFSSKSACIYMRSEARLSLSRCPGALRATAAIWAHVAKMSPRRQRNPGRVGISWRATPDIGEWLQSLTRTHDFTRTALFLRSNNFARWFMLERWWITLKWLFGQGSICYLTVMVGPGAVGILGRAGSLGAPPFGGHWRHVGR